MAEVRCKIVRFISEHPQPGWVEAVLTDADGRRLVFHDKWPVFTAEKIGPADRYPRSGGLRCAVIEEVDANGRVLIETVDGESLDGNSRFVVSSASVTDL